MATRRTSGTRSEVIRCPNCGEDYSVTYKRCPFCDERSRAVEEEFILPDEEMEREDAVKKVGRRVASRRGGGYGGSPPWGAVRILGTIASLAVIVAAVWIIFFKVGPLLDRGNIDPAPPVSATLPPPSATPAPTPDIGAVEPTVPGESEPPAVTQPPAATPSPVVTPSPAVTPPPSSKPGSTSFTLNLGDFTMKGPGDTPVPMKATGASGGVTWSSENTAVATIDAKGVVTAVGKGMTNIVATASDGAVVKCIVRVSGGPVAPPAGSAPPANSAPPAGGAEGLKLNHTDFSFSAVTNPTVTMKVTGAGGTPQWSISNTAVATIDANGKVTPVGRGTATITCKVDGQTLTCIVRCQFS